MTAIGWVAVRAAMLWPTDGPAALPRALVPAAFADSAPAVGVHPTQAPAGPVKQVASVRVWTKPDWATAASRMPIAPPLLAVAAGVPTPPPLQLDRKQETPATGPILAPPPPSVVATPFATNRWSVSGWFVLRDGRGIAPGSGSGQLGGSQAGLRIAYAIGRLAFVARVATPLHGRGREAALGVEWKPPRLPVRLAAEYRVSLDGGSSGPEVGVVAGTGPGPLAAGFDLETYGQAGVIRRRQAEAYAEGSARLARPLVKLGGARVDLGLGGWGGAQRGANRLDMGPSLGARFPLGRGAVRLSLDWRQRIAGDARPGSGAVLVIGGDF
ncbi:hypothetical protein [Sphingomonas sp.]|uniref:hypothetical protein n=1 Tax=Sphingomonas sp. TaxID=28214 RepID=UPI002E33C1DC|nr:hypothetical protein [Sphingomonas sp.]HEX4695256.1 hypothetical protein [Sphingomonas sp.]